MLGKRLGRLKSVCALSAALLVVGSASATILSFTGSASVTIREFVNGAAGQTTSDAGDFPTQDLPVQVVTRVTSTDLSNPSAAAAAAQFADPSSLSTANPQEFAINLTLNSVTPKVRYESTAVTSETRRVVFRAGELGRRSTDGQTRRVTSRLFLDGALAIISVIPGRDLTGANVTLKANITRRVTGAADETLFDGAVTLAGAENNGTKTLADGPFPTGRLILTDLSLFSANFQAFRVLIIPNVRIDYQYDVIVGQEFDLIATVTVEASNVPDNVGVAAVIGTPVQTLTEVLTATRGAQTAKEVVDAIESERANPTGDPAFESTPSSSLGGVCGAFGVESLLGMALIGGAATRKLRIAKSE